jgi:hypothetical protein
MFLALSSAAATGPRETTAHRPDAPWEEEPSLKTRNAFEGRKGR